MHVLYYGCQCGLLPHRLQSEAVTEWAACPRNDSFLRPYSFCNYHPLPAATLRLQAGANMPLLDYAARKHVTIRFVTLTTAMSAWHGAHTNYYSGHMPTGICPLQQLISWLQLGTCLRSWRLWVFEGRRCSRECICNCCCRVLHSSAISLIRTERLHSVA
jgi:hypothetical protein